MPPPHELLLLLCVVLHSLLCYPAHHHRLRVGLKVEYVALHIFFNLLLALKMREKTGFSWCYVLNSFLILRMNYVWSPTHFKIT